MDSVNKQKRPSTLEISCSSTARGTGISVSSHTLTSHSCCILAIISSGTLLVIYTFGLISSPLPFISLQLFIVVNQIHQSYGTLSYPFSRILYGFFQRTRPRNYWKCRK